MPTLTLDGNRLRKVRLSKALSIRDLATASSVSPNTVHALEHGKRTAQPGTIRTLATALDVDVTAIATLDDA